MPNETYTIKFESPLLRPGISVSCKVSKKYVVSTVNDFMNIIREINE
jgi:hypothetical protein